MKKGYWVVVYRSVSNESGVKASVVWQERIRDPLSSTTKRLGRAASTRLNTAASQPMRPSIQASTRLRP